MSKTLLAVDDSATMRKVLEITFSSEDYRVITADSSQTALAKLSEQPKIYVIDTVLGGDDGYALSKEIRKRDSAAAIVLLASRHNPFDPAKGKDAGADDFMDKPFDTQQMLDKVRKVVHGRETGVAPAAQPAAPPAAAPAARPAPAHVVPLEAAPASQSDTYMGVGSPFAAPAAAAPSPAAARPAAGKPVAAPTPAPAAVRPAPAPAPAAVRPAAAPPAATPYVAPAKAPAPAVAAVRPSVAGLGATQPSSPQPPKVAPYVAPAAHAPAAAVHHAAAAPVASVAVAGKVAGQLGGRLGELGLTPAQVEAVMALSREVVERVVWEVVPGLAEALIKEEIARLMKP